MDDETDVIERARMACASMHGVPPHVIPQVARALHEYGDKRAREALDAALAAVFRVRDTDNRSLDWCNGLNEAQDRIRALIDC